MQEKQRYRIYAIVIFIIALLSLAPKNSFAQLLPDDDLTPAGEGSETMSDSEENTPEPVATAEPVEPVEPEPAAPDAPPPPEQAKPQPEKDPIMFNAWGRVGSILQNSEDAEKMDEIAIHGQTDLHLFGNVTENFDYSFGLGGKIGPRNGFTPRDPQISLDVVVLDLRLGVEVVKEFNIWVGRQLVPADRLSLSGPYHVSTWFMPGEVGGTSRPMPAPQAGPDGRNNGINIWGSIGKGVFKYYAGAFNLHRPSQSPIFSGRLQLAVLDPEAPFFNQPDTYFGKKKQILTFGVGAQYWKDGSRGTAPEDAAGVPTGAPAPTDDFTEINADVLFEMSFEEAGALTVEGSFIKPMGDYEMYKYGWFGLLGYLIPAEVGPGKFYPVVRFHHSTFNLTNGTEIKLDTQLGYIVKGHDAKFYLGYQMVDSDGSKGNMIFLGAQLKG